jgi:hypothetical protein
MHQLGQLLEDKDLIGSLLERVVSAEMVDNNFKLFPES